MTLFNLLFYNSNNFCSIAVECQIFQKMEVCRLHYFIFMPIIGSLLESKPFNNQTSRIKQLRYHLQVIKSQIPENKARKHMLILIIEMIYSNSIYLYA